MNLVEKIKMFDDETLKIFLEVLENKILSRRHDYIKNELKDHSYEQLLVLKTTIKNTIMVRESI